MRVWGLIWAATLLTGLVSCDPPALVGAGQACNSLSDCKEGLSCIEGVCDDDLSSIAGQVPVYADGAAGTASDAGSTAAAP